MLAKGEVPELLIVQNKNKTAVAPPCRPNHDKGFPWLNAWQTVASRLNRRTLFSRHATQGSEVTVEGATDAVGGFGSPWALQSKKWIFRKRNLQALPEVIAFALVIYLKKAIRALSFCVVDQYPIFAFLLRTKLQVIKSAPGSFLGGGNITSQMACQENGIGLIANYTFQTDRAKEKYFIMQSSCSGPQTSEKK